MQNIGSRAEVWHKKARRTSGYLFRKDLVMNPYNRIVSKKKHILMKTKKNPLRERNMLQGKKSKHFGPKNNILNKKVNKKSNKKSNKNFFESLLSF